MTSAESSLNRSELEAEHSDVVVAEAGQKRTQEEASIETELDTVTDEEVEEFCAILRRLRRPVKYFGGIGRMKRWRPSFMPEDFNGVEEVVVAREKVEKQENGGGDGGGVEIEKRLDLNVRPLTE